MMQKKIGGIFLAKKMSWLYRWDNITMYFKPTPEQTQKPKPKGTAETAEDFRRKQHSYHEDKRL